MINSQNRVLRGSKQICHELRVSRSTLGRMIRKGLVSVEKGCTGGKTSPLIMRADALRDPKKD